MDEAGWGAEPEGEGRREGLRLSGGRDCSDSAPSGLRARPMGWLLTCGPTGPLDSPASSLTVFSEDTHCLLSHFHPQGPKLIHSCRVDHRAYVHAVLSAWSGLHVTKLKPLMLGLLLNIAFSSKPLFLLLHSLFQPVFWCKIPRKIIYCFA